MGKKDSVVIAVAAVLALVIVGGIGVLIADTVKKNIPEETSERGSGTLLTEAPGTSAAPVEESVTDLPFPTAPVQTREITTQEVTTEEPVTVPVTTPEPTTEEITTAAPTLPVTQPPTVPADPSTAVFVPTHVEGSTLTGRTEKGYDIEVKDGIVRLTVARTSKLVRYGVSSGATPSALASDSDFAPKDGDDLGDIVIEAPAKGDSGFFSVGRAPLK